jgi:hypothetical protein
LATLQDIKADLPEWPDDVIDQWLLKFANQPEMGWPPPEPYDCHRWGLLLTHPLSWWKNVTWSLETRDCSFDELSADGRRTMNSMYAAIVGGVDNGFGGDNSPERFRRQLAILVRSGKFERPPVLFPIASGLSPLDGNHRLFALVVAKEMPDEAYIQQGASRPSTSQEVWIASHKDGEDPG